MGPSRAEYEPFVECGEGHASNGECRICQKYLTSVWGGQLELRSLSEGLWCPIVVFSAEAPLLTMDAKHAPAGKGDDGEDWGARKAPLLSFLGITMPWGSIASL